jgi:hypothetical protein
MSERNGLSVEQVNLLLHLLLRTREVRDLDLISHPRDHVDHDGVYLGWQPAGDYGAEARGDWSRSESASQSRTLRRLRQRGLVWCGTHYDLNDPRLGGPRTTIVKLTPAGLALAEKLADAEWPPTWREDHKQRLTVENDNRCD